MCECSQFELGVRGFAKSKRPDGSIPAGAHMFKGGKVLSRVRDERNYVMRDQSKPITLFPFVRHFIHASTWPYTHSTSTAH